MTSLLNTLSTEVHSLTKVSDISLQGILSETKDVIAELKRMEQALDSDQDLAINDYIVTTDKWYKNSMNHLKSYNAGINRFQKNGLSNRVFSVDLDDAYTFPLNIDGLQLEHSTPKNSTPQEIAMNKVKAENQQELSKAIILHLLKIGEADIINDMIPQINEKVRNYDPNQTNSTLVDEGSPVHPTLMHLFKFLEEVVREIVDDHDLSRSIRWFIVNNKGYNKSNCSTNENLDQAEFKFHLVQFTLLLSNHYCEFSLEYGIAAYDYANKYFAHFCDSYLNEVSLFMLLLSYETPQQNNLENGVPEHNSNKLDDFIDQIRLEFPKSSITSGISEFVGELLDEFQTIHLNTHIFQLLANEFISCFCKNMNLLSDSSLFQSLLCGFINLPSFHKYNKIQHKLNKVVTQEETAVEAGITKPVSQLIVAPYSYDLPFQLSDTNRFLFNYHPIFICPVTKDQLIPITNDTNHHFNGQQADTGSDSLLQPHQNDNQNNPVVVLTHCRHLALKESIWNLSKRGCDIFKCHYCYTQHTFSEVKEAYFIDL